MKVEAQQLVVGYQGEPVVEVNELVVEPGKLVAILGPNGTGKTTLLKALAGMLRPMKGTVYVDGLEIHRLSRMDRARLVTYLPPSIARSLETTTVLDLLLSARLPYSRALQILPSRRDLDVVEAIIERLGLGKLVTRRLTSLSSGELQRVLLAFALAKESDVILADEPTAFLDLYYKVNVFDLLRNLASTEGKTVVVATHELFLAPKYADIVVMLSKGRIVALGEPSHVLREELIEEVFGVKVEVRVQDGRLTITI